MECAKGRWISDQSRLILRRWSQRSPQSLKTDISDRLPYGQKNQPMEFQQNLRPVSVHAAERVRALSGISSGHGEDSLRLFDLVDPGEVAPLRLLTPAPLTKNWFAGLANTVARFTASLIFRCCARRRDYTVKR